VVDTVPAYEPALLLHPPWKPATAKSKSRHLGPNPASTALSSGTITRSLPLRRAAAVG